MNVQGKFFLIQKHHTYRAKKTGKSKPTSRRKFYDDNELKDAEELAKKYAANNHEDFLLVQVIKEYTKSTIPLDEIEDLKRLTR
jgi:hypothetical protein